MAVQFAIHPTKSENSLDAVSLASAFGAGTEYALLLGSQGTPYITWQTVFSAAPGSVTVLLEASLDGTNWFTVDTSTNVNGEIRSLHGPYKFLRINNSAVTVGAGITLTASILYTNSVPSFRGRKVIFSSSEEKTTAGTSAEDLYSVVIPANTLLRDGDFLDIVVGGVKANNGNALTVEIILGGVVVISSTTATALGEWVITTRIFYRNSTTLVAVGQIQRTGNQIASVNEALTIDPTVENTLTLTVTTGVAAGDWTAYAMSVESSN